MRNLRIAPVTLSAARSDCGMADEFINTDLHRDGGAPCGLDRLEGPGALSRLERRFGLCGFLEDSKELGITKEALQQKAVMS